MRQRRLSGAAIEVHRELGPGLLESIYEECLCREFHARDIPYRRQVDVDVLYKRVRLDCGYRIDLMVFDGVVVELKTVDHILPVHTAQLLTYLRLTGKRVGALDQFQSSGTG